jgi:hypothetical protein
MFPFAQGICYFRWVACNGNFLISLSVDSKKAVIPAQAGIYDP